MVRACCTLHNYVRARDGVDYDLMNGDTGFVGVQNNQQGHPRPATTIRDEFSEYFLSVRTELISSVNKFKIDK